MYKFFITSLLLGICAAVTADTVRQTYTVHYEYAPDYEQYMKLYQLKPEEVDRKKLSRLLLDKAGQLEKFTDAAVLHGTRSDRLTLDCTSKVPPDFIKNYLLLEYHTFEVRLVDEDLTKNAQAEYTRVLKAEHDAFAQELRKKGQTYSTEYIDYYDYKYTTRESDIRLSEILRQVKVPPGSEIRMPLGMGSDLRLEEWKTQHKQPFRLIFIVAGFYLLADEIQSGKEKESFYRDQADIAGVCTAVELDGSDILSAEAGIDVNSLDWMTITMNKRGAGKLEALCGTQNIGRRAALLFDGRVLAITDIGEGITKKNIKVCSYFDNNGGHYIASLLNQISRKESVRAVILKEKVTRAEPTR